MNQEAHVTSYLTSAERSVSPNLAIKAAKVIGGSVLGAGAGLLAAKGFDAYVLDVEPGLVFEGAVTAASAALCGFFAAEISG